MRFVAAFALAAALSGSAMAQDGQCVSIAQARDYVGKSVCVRGKVFKVGYSSRGTAFINFCADYKRCPFTAVVFERDIKNVGNLDMFKGRMLEVTGKVRMYKESAEIVVKSREQFGGEALSPRLSK